MARSRRTFVSWAHETQPGDVRPRRPSICVSKPWNSHVRQCGVRSRRRGRRCSDARRGDCRRGPVVLAAAPHRARRRRIGARTRKPRGGARDHARGRWSRRFLPVQPGASDIEPTAHGAVGPAGRRQRGGRPAVAILAARVSRGVGLSAQSPCTSTRYWVICLIRAYAQHCSAALSAMPSEDSSSSTASSRSGCSSAVTALPNRPPGSRCPSPTTPK